MQWNSAITYFEDVIKGTACIFKDKNFPPSYH